MPTASPLASPLGRAPAGLAVAGTTTLRPVVHAWAVCPDGSVVVARGEGGSHLAMLAGEGYQRLAELPLPAHRIHPAPEGWTWVRCWPVRLAQRASGRPFGRELLPVAPDGVLAGVLTMEGAIVDLVATSRHMLVATAGGALSCFAPDGSLRWRRTVSGWPASPEQRVWVDRDGDRIWVAERGGVTELDTNGGERWSWRASTAGSAMVVRPAELEESARVLGVSAGAGPEQVRRAFRRRAKETHPDRHPELPDAAELFKAVARAYDVLVRKPRNEPGQPASAFLAVSESWPAGPEGVWVATRAGAWFRLDANGAEREQGSFQRQSPVVLAVSDEGALLAAGQEGELRLSSGPGIGMPAGWDFRLHPTGGLLVAYGRDRLATVSPAGSLDAVALQRPAQVGWAAGCLYLFFPEGDYCRLSPVVRSGSPSPPTALP